MKTKLICLLIRHDWIFISRDRDWLWGGHYYYECKRCGKTKVTTPYSGGFE